MEKKETVSLTLFDEPVERRHTHSAKWDGAYAQTGNPDILPLSLADMDFRSPSCVTEALTQRVKTGLFGYETEYPEVNRAVENWMRTRHQTEVTAGVTTPGVVSALLKTAACFAPEAKGIAVFTPIYGHFYETAPAAGLPLFECPLLYDRDRGTWKMDLNRLDDGFKQGFTLLMFCSPHNPVGRVWTREELTGLVALCRRYHARIISDEIHMDLIMPGNEHTCMLRLDPEAVVLTAPSKTFNIAGLRHSNVFASPATQRKIGEAWEEERFRGGNVLSYVAEYAAYTYGAPWLDALLAYLDRNRAYVEEEIRTRFPGIALTKLEGTYLMWLDFTSYGMPHEELKKRLTESGLVLGDGLDYGKGCEGFMRLNIGTQKANLSLFLERLEKALS